MLRKKLLSFAVPVTVAVAAFLHAQAIGALVDGAIATSPGHVPASIAPFAEARAATAGADTILSRNPFDHEAKMSVPEAVASEDPLLAPACDGVRATVALHGDEVARSLAALDVAGKHVVQRGGGRIGDWSVVYVATDRVWLQRGSHLCQAPLFAPTVLAKPTVAAAPAGTAFEQEIAAKVTKTGTNAYAIDRGALDRILEAETELLKTPLVPEVDGLRLVRVKPGSVLATLGLEAGDRLVALNGIEVTSPAKMLEAYARLKTGTLDRWTIQLVRNGATVNLDYAIH